MRALCFAIRLVVWVSLSGVGGVWAGEGDPRDSATILNFVPSAHRRCSGRLTGEPRVVEFVRPGMAREEKPARRQTTLAEPAALDQHTWYWHCRSEDGATSLTVALTFKATARNYIGRGDLHIHRWKGIPTGAAIPMRAVTVDHPATSDLFIRGIDVDGSEIGFSLLAETKTSFVGLGDVVINMDCAKPEVKKPLL